MYTAGRQNLLAGCFALDAVLKEIKTGDWKSSGIQRVVLKTRDNYLDQGAWRPSFHMGDA